MKIPIFLPSDNNYAPFVATTITSICHNTNAFIDFYILDSGINNENQQKIRALMNQFDNFSIEFLKIDTNIAFKNFQVPSNLNLSTYNRLLIPQLKPDLNKVLYLDTDIVVLGDVAELYEIDLDNFALAAAWDKSRILYNIDTKNLMELSDNYKYFNAGVLILDIPKWNQDRIVFKLFEIQKKYDGNILHADESLLNKYFDNNFKVFDIKYNYLDYDVLNSPNSEIKIRHFATPMKPWNSNYSVLDKRVVPLKNYQDFWYYAQMTSFYDEIKEIYNKSINSNVLKKRMSLIAQKLMNQ